jgi:ATP-dependent protease HslVU (ClpYQ) peptidase subunit
VTAVVALRHAGGVTIGSDSLVSGDGFEWVEDEPKFARVGDAVVGFCGNPRECHLVEAVPRLRAPRRDERPILYVAHVIAEAIRQTHRAYDAENKEFSALIVWRGEVYELIDGYGVTRPALEVAAVGSGAAVALGALRSSLRLSPDLAPRAHVENALAVASELCAGVGGPPHVLDVRTRKR